MDPLVRIIYLQNDLTDLHKIWCQEYTLKVVRRISLQPVSSEFYSCFSMERKSKFVRSGFSYRTLVSYTKHGLLHNVQFLF
jgi:hypothetical protein